MEGYNQEIKDQIIKDVYLRAKANKGLSANRVAGKATTESMSTEATISNANRITEIDKELKNLEYRIKGTGKSVTKYPTQETKDAHINELKNEIDKLIGKALYNAGAYTKDKAEGIIERYTPSFEATGIKSEDKNIVLAIDNDKQTVNAEEGVGADVLG